MNPRLLVALYTGGLSSCPRLHVGVGVLDVCNTTNIKRLVVQLYENVVTGYRYLTDIPSVHSSGGWLYVEGSSNQRIGRRTQGGVTLHFLYRSSCSISTGSHPSPCLRH